MNLKVAGWRRLKFVNESTNEGDHRQRGEHDEADQPRRQKHETGEILRDVRGSCFLEPADEPPSYLR